MSLLSHSDIWFLTGSQHLYGPDVLEQVMRDSQEIVTALDAALPVNVRFKPVLTTAEDIYSMCQAANHDTACVGVITWMHTFSPARNWIAGLTCLEKPIAHLHTQYNRDIPWRSIDMDFMNLNQAAHGDREFGYMMTRMNLPRKVVVGFWQDKATQRSLEVWARAACAFADSRRLRIARFGDNMRSVAVTEGDKVAAQMQFGYQVHGYGVGDLVRHVRAVTESEVSRLVQDYCDSYLIPASLQNGSSQLPALYEAARIELGLRSFLQDGAFNAFTTTFEDLHGLAQLPGLAVQRLMADGYGFGAEGDWKTAALLRSMKVMGQGLPGGASFMEDYTYHMNPEHPQVLGAHMLEVCPTIAHSKPSLEVHPLGIGGKADPARLVFNAAPGPAVNATLVDMGGRFRMIVNSVRVILPKEPLSKLPVARALWEPEPDFSTAAAAWIYAGGAHHTGFSQALTPDHLYDFAEMIGVEYLQIDATTQLRSFKNELRWNAMSYRQ